MTNNLKRAIDTDLGGLRTTQRERAMIFSNVLEGKKVKKKLSVAFVLVLTLLLMAVTALAMVTWKAYMENVIATEADKGYFDAWSLDVKLKFIEAMQSNGIELPQDKIKSLNDPTLTELQKDQIAKAIITERYGEEGAISHISIMEKENGPYGTWSIQDKAWYTDQLDKYGLLGDDEGRNILPGPKDVTQEDALHTAQDAIRDAYGLDEKSLANYSVDIYFRAYPQKPEQRVWLFEFRPSVETRRSTIVDYYAAISALTGQVFSDAEIGIKSPSEAASDAASQKSEAEELDALRAQKGETYKWSLEELAKYFPTYGLPKADDITQDEAISIARNAIMQSAGITEEILKQYTPYALYVIDDVSLPVPFWMVHLIVEDDSGRSQKILTVYLDVHSGDVLKVDGVGSSNG